jgi:hypothetical protein
MVTDIGAPATISVTNSHHPNGDTCRKNPDFFVTTLATAAARRRPGSVTTGDRKNVGQSLAVIKMATEAHRRSKALVTSVVTASQPAAGSLVTSHQSGMATNPRTRLATVVTSNIASD